ncbi:hypothetical protein MXB_2618 [Myxobolus squamalis]|nr:hypothetical protein MXB_2618 [Myxobolus squamalis]
MESDRYICVCDKTSTPPQVVIIDVQTPGNIFKRQTVADSARMCPTSNHLALISSRNIQVFNLDTKKKIKAYGLPDEVKFWKWISGTIIALVTESCVYHWSTSDDSDAPTKMFDRHASTVNAQVINYHKNHDGKWLALVVISAQENRVVGTIQLFSIARNTAQAIQGHACTFTNFLIEGNTCESNVFLFATRSEKDAKIHIIELDSVPAGNQPLIKRKVDLGFPPNTDSDFPIAIHADKKSGLFYVITKLGYIHMYELASGECIFGNNISKDVVFITAQLQDDNGFICINRTGSVLSISVNRNQIVPYLIDKGMQGLAVTIAARTGFPGAEGLLLSKFNEYFNQRLFDKAAIIAAKSTGTAIRNSETIAKFVALGEDEQNPSSPILTYFSTILKAGKLNELESVELCNRVLMNNKKNLIEKWMKEDKLECTEELGNLIKNVDTNIALSVYLRANSHAKVVQCFAETGQYEKILSYCQKVNYQPDYLRIFRSILYTNADTALQFAKDLLQKNTKGLDVELMANCFLQQNFTSQCISFLRLALEKNLPEQAELQTKLIELSIMSNQPLAEEIFERKLLTQFDKNHVAKLCEQIGLNQRALQFYTDIYDIKRIIVQTHLLNPEWLVNYFGSLSVDDSLACLRALLEFQRLKNLPIVIEIAHAYHEQLGVNALISLFEDCKSSEGLFLFLNSIVNFSQDPEVQYKYIQAACKTNQSKEVERICRESNCYDPEKVKNFLKESKLTDQIPLIVVCDRFNFVEELVLHLHRNNYLKYIEVYVQKVNPARLPEIVGALLDVDCHEDFIKNMIMGCTGNYSMTKLLEEVRKRNRIKIIRPMIESRIASGSTDPSLHSAFGIVCIDSNNRPDVFLKENLYYDSLIVGSFCEKQDPILACLAYEKGGNSDELINVCVVNSLFKILARYVILKKDPELWVKVLDPVNDYRRSLIEQASQSAVTDSFDPECVTIFVKALMIADLSHDLVELLEKIVLADSPYRSFRNLQNLLLLTAIKSDTSRIIDFVNRLDNFDAASIASVAIDNKLYEEAFAIYKKFQVHDSAVKVLTENIKNLDRAFEYTERCNVPAAWTILGKAQLMNDQPKEAIESFLKSGDFTSFPDIIAVSDRFPIHESLVKYLAAVRSTMKDSRVDSEYAYCLAYTDRFEVLQDLFNQPHNINTVLTGDRLFEQGKYEAAKYFFKHATNFPKLAATYVKLREFQSAVEMARRANNTKMWKVVCFACVDAGEFQFAKICGLNLVIHPEELLECVKKYEQCGYFMEFIALMEASVNLERAHMGIFTELSILYCKHRPSKLRDHLDIYWTRINIPKVIKAAESYHLWSEMAFLYEKYEDFDNAIFTMIRHPSVAFNETQFRDIIQKVANQDLYHKSISFYHEYKPLQLNDLMIALSPRVDHAKAIKQLISLNVLCMCKSYLLHVQKLNISVINEALNQLYIEEESYDELRNSVENYTNYEATKLAEQLQNHSSIEFRRISTLIRKFSNRWSQTLEMAKKDQLYDDAIIYATESRDPEIAHSLLEHFIEINRPDCVVSLLYFCYDIVVPDQVMLLCWLNDMMHYCMPYTIQLTRESVSRLNAFEARQKQVNENLDERENPVYFPSNTTQQLMIGASGFPSTFKTNTMMSNHSNATSQQSINSVMHKQYQNPF